MDISLRRTLARSSKNYSIVYLKFFHLLYSLRTLYRDLRTLAQHHHKKANGVRRNSLLLPSHFQFGRRHHLYWVKMLRPRCYGEEILVGRLACSHHSRTLAPAPTHFVMNLEILTLSASLQRLGSALPSSTASKLAASTTTSQSTL